MSNFNIDVGLNPDRGVSTDQTPNVLKASYGDGYEQRSTFGINTIREEWSLTWSNKILPDANKIIRFLETEGGVTAFDWYPPDTVITSTTTSAVNYKLIDTDQHFTNRYLGATVTDSEGNDATVTAIDSATTLSLDNDILIDGEAYTLTPPDKKYICEKWAISIPFSGYRTVTATFKEVFEP